MVLYVFIPLLSGSVGYGSIYNIYAININIWKCKSIDNAYDDKIPKKGRYVVNIF